MRLAGDMRVPRAAVERLIAEAMPRPARGSEGSITSEPTDSGRNDFDSGAGDSPAQAAAEPKRAAEGISGLGAAKLAKERAQERREKENREREARYRYHPPRSHDSAIAWPASTYPRNGKTTISRDLYVVRTYWTSY